MKNLLIVVVVLIVAVAALGFYRGWFHVASASADGESNLTLTVDKDKMKEDKAKAMDRVHELGHQAKDTAGEPAEKSGKREAAPSAQPPQNQ